MESSSAIIKFWHKNWHISIVILIAAVLRLYQIGDYMEFLGDQGRDMVIVRDFLKNGNLFFIGPQTSIGNMYLGPFYYYLIAPSLWLANYNPIGPAILVALIGVATVALIYFVTAKWFDPKTALIAAFLYASSPTVIKYSNFSWNPNVMPFFSLLFIYLFWRKNYILASFAFIMALNSHFLALLLLPTAFVIWLQNRSHHQSLRPIIIAAAIFLISLTPQILFDIKHQGQNIKAITGFFTKRETTVNAKLYKAIPKLFPLHFQITTSLPAARNQLLGYIIGTILIFGTIYLLIISDFRHYFLLWWYLVGLIGLGVYKQHVYDHYFGFIFPVLYIILAKIITKHHYLGYLIIIPILIFSVSNSPLRHPLKQLSSNQKITQLINQNSNGQPFNFALIAKQNYDPPYLYFFYQSGSPVYHINNKLTDQLFVVCEPFQVDCNPINHPEWSIAAFGWAKIDNQWQVDDKIVYRLVHTQP